MGIAEQTPNVQRDADITAGSESLLGSQKLVAFVATRNPGRAKEFYRDVLGLRLISEDVSRSLKCNPRGIVAQF
jgi:Glyoxalase/Bleomycin resistance protein/Dioxygenase superfamily